MAGPIDWERIEGDYRAGILSLREIAEAGGCTEGAIRKRAKRDGWDRGNVAEHRNSDTRAAILRRVKDEPKRVPIRQKAGFLYVIYIDDSASERFYKIGMSETFSARFTAHQCASPFDICVACAYFVPDMRAEERGLHVLFADKRVRGEWFRLTVEDVRLIAARAALV